MTEEEAKTKWCPCARGIMDAGGNRMAWGGDGGEPNLPDDQAEYGAEMADLYPCIGSACMAWRVSDRQRFRHEEIAQEQTPSGEGWYLLNPTQTGAGRLWLRDVPMGVDGGFCGLAGRPE